jgi:hypothetical protein
MNPINPVLLYELGELREPLGAAYEPLVAGTKAARTPEAVTCPHLRFNNEVWVKGEDVMNWLGVIGEVRLPQSAPKGAKGTQAPAPQAAPKPVPQPVATS